jgi:CAS/CSE protein, C-terminus
MHCAPWRRLQSAPTTKYSRGLVVFIAFFVCKHGGATVLDSIDALQPQPPLSAQILDSVWAPTLPQVISAHPGQQCRDLSGLARLLGCPAWGWSYSPAVMQTDSIVVRL